MASPKAAEEKVQDKVLGSESKDLFDAIDPSGFPQWGVRFASAVTSYQAKADEMFGGVPNVPAAGAEQLSGEGHGHGWWQGPEATGGKKGCL